MFPFSKLLTHFSCKRPNANESKNNPVQNIGCDIRLLLKLLYKTKQFWLGMVESKPPSPPTELKGLVIVHIITA